MRARKTSTRSKILRAIARRGGNLDERQFARDRRRLGDVVHIDDIFKFKQAGADAMAGLCGSLADQRQPRQPRALAAPHGERVDVDVQTAEERCHARKHARQIFNVSDECVQHKVAPSFQPLSFQLFVPALIASATHLERETLKARS